MRSHKSLGTAEAQLAIGTIQTEMSRRGKAGVIAVADDHGELIGLLRVDGAPLSSIVIATNKAWTAARERKPSYELGQASRDPKTGFDIAYYGDPRYLGWGGGVPVVVAGAVVGSIAVSGLAEQEDMELAEMAARAIVDAIGRASA
jgi:glc operon protein GlcG